MRKPAEQLVARKPGDPPTAFICTGDGMYVRLSSLPFEWAVVTAHALLGKPLLAIGGERVLPIDEALDMAETLHAARPYEDGDLVIETIKRYRAAFRAGNN